MELEMAVRERETDESRWWDWSTVCSATSPSRRSDHEPLDKFDRTSSTAGCSATHRQVTRSTAKCQHCVYT